MEYFHQGHWRMDWGLGNPNKTAVLIACLLVLAWVSARKGRWGFWATFGLSLGLGICLIHTYSRGGFVAAFVGLAVVMWHHREVVKVRRLVLFVGALALVIYANLGFVEAGNRLVLGVTVEDRSISNRLEIWKQTPRMMVDAPTGWGLGNSGTAFTQWYQSPGTRLEYRTLVNSHLTWLVEFGWAGRFCYILAWLTVLSLCAGGNRIALGVWLAFGVGAWFSSVAENWVLWVLPIASLITILIWRGRRRDLPSWKLVTSLVGVSLIVAGLTFGFGLVTPTEIPIQGNRDTIQLGTGELKAALIAPDRRILGSHFGIETRKLAGGDLEAQIQVIYSANGLPPAETLVFCGSGLGNVKLREENRRIFFLNPDSLSALSSIESARQNRVFCVLLGSLRADPSARKIRQYAPKLGWEIREIPGNKTFLPDWSEILAEVSENP